MEFNLKKNALRSFLHFGGRGGIRFFGEEYTNSADFLDCHKVVTRTLHSALNFTVF